MEFLVGKVALGQVSWSISDFPSQFHSISAQLPGK
jgi:hypothetical protein